MKNSEITDFGQVLKDAINKKKFGTTVDSEVEERRVLERREERKKHVDELKAAKRKLKEG